MKAYRIGDMRWAMFDGTGSLLRGGRWNSPGRPVIYAAQTYAGALLETLVHTSTDHVPRNHASLTIDIADDLQTASINAQGLDLSPDANPEPTQALGDAWLHSNDRCILLVPSFVLQGRENNVLINPRHPAFARLVLGVPQPVVWDARLFRQLKG